jgi:hypothetical protein
MTLHRSKEKRALRAHILRMNDLPDVVMSRCLPAQIGPTLGQSVVKVTIVRRDVTQYDRRCQTNFLVRSRLG